LCALRLRSIAHDDACRGAAPPAVSPILLELARFSNVVFSTTLQEPLAWPNTRLVSQDAVEVVWDMKADGANHMTTMGSLTLCRSLLKAGLVDRFRAVVFPVITGSTGSDPDLRRVSTTSLSI
jgi:dihydrofolate reductase